MSPTPHSHLAPRTSHPKPKPKHHIMVIKIRKAAVAGRPHTNKAIEPATTATKSLLHLLLPLIAGLFHLQVFYYAAFRYIIPRFLPQEHNLISYARTTALSSHEFMNECYLLDRAIFIAYMFDLLCCYLNIIPFSRCNSSRDIIGHHVPTLLLALPLAIPLWANRRDIDPAVFFILEDERVAEIRNRFMDAYILASGFAYISSLNEVIMCFQRVEMSLGGITNFNDTPLMKKKRMHLFFTSRVVVGFELCYKLCFFWGISIVAFKACFDADKCLFDAITSPVTYDEPMWKTLITIYSSPAILRGALFRAFSIVMYPSMGFRCLKKIKQYLMAGEILSRKRKS